MNWNAPEVTTLIRLALREDQARNDQTSLALVGKSWRVRTVVRAKQRGVISGLPLAKRIVEMFDRLCRWVPVVADGTHVKAGAVVAKLDGPARSVLSVERPALNALQHLSGIATYTANAVKRLHSAKTNLLDTRKTIPGWRVLEKYAVTCGGGKNHRMSLSDAILVKENHLRMSRLAGRDWVQDLQRFSRAHPQLSIQAEIQTEQDLRDVLVLRPSRVLLDNMPVARLRKVIRRLRRVLPRTEIEVSGGVSPDDLPRLGRLGVERISMGKLTHSAPAFDCSLDILRVDPR